MKIALIMLMLSITGCVCERCVPTVEKVEIKEIISQGYTTNHKGTELFIIQNFTKEIVTISIKDKVISKSNEIYIRAKIEKIKGVRTAIILSNKIIIEVDTMEWIRQKDEIMDCIILCNYEYIPTLPKER